MERRLIERSLQDDAFRQRLLEDPRATMEQELGAKLPADVQITAVEESADTIYLVLPATPMAGREGVELSDRDLESVAGAGTWGQLTCASTCDDQCTSNCTGDFICTTG
jgi:Nitrile hydratase, alpha chain